MVKVYSKDNCVQCKATMRYLDKRNVPYEVESATEHAQMLQDKGFTQAPVVVVRRADGSTRSWAGYNVGNLQDLVETMVHS